MHCPTFIFLLPHQIATVQQNNQNKITSNNRKINHKNNHDKQFTIAQSKNQSGNTITTNNHSTKYYQKQQSYQSAAKTATTINKFFEYYYI